MSHPATVLPSFTISPASPDPLHQTSFLALLFTVVCHVLALLTSNYSWVDRLWSIAPVVYVWVLAGQQAGGDVRSLVVCGCVTFWGARLTLNFARKGGYNPKDEDYRWAVLRKAIPSKILWHLFSLLFISVYQNFILLLISLPTYIVHRASVLSPTPWSNLDTTLLVLFAAFLVGETIADNQQFAYQTKKHQLIRKAQMGDKDASTDNLGLPQVYARGYLTTGLFRYSRHPNFFCEIMIWWCIYGFSVAATIPKSNGLIDLTWSNIVNWTIIGPIMLTLLFQGSTSFTEGISAKKYPTYQIYQKTTSRLVPMWPGKDVDQQVKEEQDKRK
ncbi:uncharacterized protein SPPG_07935 [Spizellomyces punctatus DAOM BR117]|uniref:Uncharacterized protein n=1 Tax=Spizellomyces punctatus (strain DAOM BR117) TaxID=645134 RepID=A0A0L0H768_SPIPD|nr:uncharacterized protein SPPG_07935 [Spizellomyces punctatus DAOM BR117]KNC96726.1 hypothetical protein SPPG_07935 [Spizellomyces punctatus DAOM BR117]|eukprot:XP_016604766.1 hypothetical protein SPPG_07935 [Spizellomyces punctatus DAOM BR117]